MDQKLAQEALNSQSACNASALILSAAARMPEIWAEVRAHGGGTEAVNTHPYVVLITTQLAHLSGCGMTDTATYAKAFEACSNASGLCDGACTGCPETGCATNPQGEEIPY